MIPRLLLMQCCLRAHWAAPTRKRMQFRYSSSQVTKLARFFFTSPSQTMNNIYNTPNSDAIAKKCAYKPKNSPRTDPPPGQPQRMQATERAPAIFTTTFEARTRGTMQTSVKICARGYLDVFVGVENAQMTTCKGRGRGWSAVHT